jgi:four helix bundle protein
MNQDQISKAKPLHEFDLEDRTSVFGEKVINFAKLLAKNPVNISLISQLVRAGTSVGANYCEANESVSKKEFLHRISIYLKEAKETKYWIRMIVTAEPQLKDEAEKLGLEAKELALIFAAIRRNTH